MHLKKRPLDLNNKNSIKTALISTLLIALSIFSTYGFADFGENHKERHKKHHKENQDNRQGKNYNSRSTAPATNLKYNPIAPVTESMHRGAVETHMEGHVVQSELEGMPTKEAFITAFEEGDELFEINYNAIDGVGANVGNGKRFTSLPRIDLKQPKAWASHIPERITGPNANSCISCHQTPVPDGAGKINDNTVRIDPSREQRGFIERQAPHMFGSGSLQLLAEEMTTDLQSIRQQAIDESCENNKPVKATLISKDKTFGSIRANCNKVNYRQLKGIDEDLVVKPYEWKGLTASVRGFIRGAANQELGLQAVELVGDQDNDYDQVTNELSVGDITALTIYAAAQPRPASKLELNYLALRGELDEEAQKSYGLPLDTADIQAIENGAQVFEDMECSKCHKSSLTLNSTIYKEPSTHPAFSDAVFPAGATVPLPQVAIEFDLTKDLEDNPFTLESGQTLGQFEKNSQNQGVVRLYGDLKRHNMGRQLAEEIDEGYVGASVFMTENLWGVGSTGPYLHDGRATTLTEAIMYHGGDAKQSKENFADANSSDQNDLIQFLESLVLFLDGE